ncbi:MAG: type II secretion system protein M [Gammaproteobacteria bacterium]|nr:type II secretion system protein M [Gammaproteobacteria bacterium]
MNSRVRLLLGFAATLAVVRFVLVPWAAAQDDVHDRLYAVTRQLDRAEAIVEAGSELQARRDALAAIVSELAARAPLARSGSEHRVQVQRELRAAVESAGLELKVFEWVFDGEAEAAGLSFGRLRLQLEGSLRNVADAHVGIEAGFPNVFVREMSVNVRGSGGLAGTANTTMELDLYYRREEEV